MTAQEKKWIDASDYETLLQHWRFAKAGNMMFKGDTGEYYSKVMLEKKEALGAEAVAVSKRIGL